MADAGLLGRLYRGGCLLELVGTRSPGIGDQENAMCRFKCGLESLGVVEVGFEDFVGQSAVLGWMASQRAHLELALGLEGTHDCASLLPRCADHRDQLLAVG